MAFKQVEALDADITYSLGKLNKKTGKTDPKQAEGYYLGNREIEGGKYGKSVLHFLKTPKGNLGVWGGGDMNKKLSGVVPGTMVRITANGTRPTPRGDMKVFTVEVDSDNVLEGYSAPGQFNESSVSYDDGGDDVDSSNEDAEDDLQQQALVAAENQAKVQALLNKNRKPINK